MGCPGNLFFISRPVPAAPRSSRHDSLADDGVQGQLGATMPRGRIEVGLGHIVVAALRVEEDKLGDLPFLEQPQPSPVGPFEAR